MNKIEISFNIAEFLEKKIKACAVGANDTLFNETFYADVRSADPRFGDYQANGILPFAKAISKNPRELANSIVEILKNSKEFPEELYSLSIAGPGFINFKLSPSFYLEWLKTYKTVKSLQTASSHYYKGKTITVDYSSPNTAKQMHVGHLRSLVIGEAIKRLLTFCGAHVIGDNHIGDWGTQFGIIIMAVRRLSYDLDAPHADVLEDLEGIYQKGRELFDNNEEAKEEARIATALLQKEDPECLAIWEKISTVSYKAFQEIYDLFKVKFDVVMGESSYRNDVERIYEELSETGIAKESNGALVTFLPMDGREDYPFIIRKADGASNYASTDLATIYHHANIFKADEMVYVTDGRQQDHFKCLGMVSKMWFDAKGYNNLPKFSHPWFGSILGEDGKAIKTRAGKSIKLKELLQEAIDRAMKVVEEKSPELSPEEKNEVARIIGIGAIRYADLSQNRSQDYIFSWNKLLSFDGNTAPYLLYAVARIRSIFRKLDITPGSNEELASPLESEKELELAKKLTVFPVALSQAVADLRPHFICTYLFELAGCFSSFYSADKVIVDEPDIRARRLMLCARTLLILDQGLQLLGLETLDKM